jgi:hypothetical protein
MNNFLVLAPVEIEGRAYSNQGKLSAGLGPLRLALIANTAKHSNQSRLWLARITSCASINRGVRPFGSSTEESRE